MLDLESLDRRGEGARERKALLVAGFAQDTNADIGPAASHGKHPAISRSDIFVEPDWRLAIPDLNALDVGSLRNRNMRAVGHVEVERSRDEGLRAICTHNQPGSE